MFIRRPIQKVLLAILALFIAPLAVHAALYASKEHPRSFRDADWSTVGMLPPATADRDARLLVFTGRTGRWKGIFAVHSWVVFKAQNATAWNRYDVVGWGQPVRFNGWDPDGRWFGDTPRVLVDIRGEKAVALIPKVRNAIRAYDYGRFGDYRIWPGPNSNTFTAAVLRAVPEIEVTFRRMQLARISATSLISASPTAGQRIEASLWGILGVKIGWVEGVELNFLGLVAGLDLRHPALKLPGFGRLGLR